MKKKELLKLKKLTATKAMMEQASKDTPVKKLIYNYTADSYQCGIYYRCQVMKGILKVAFFLARDLRLGNRNPVYEVFLDKAADTFLTWDVVHNKWRSAKLDMLEWPEYTHYSGYYTNKAMDEKIMKALGVNCGGYKGILAFQQRVREDQLKQKYRRETLPWDLEMAQIPKLPKDWNAWLMRHGVQKHYIFYDYIRKGAREGYCTWCGRNVEILNPKHNAYGVCKRCGHKIQYKARGKAGTFDTESDTAYLIQRCESGFVIRQFKIYCRYRKAGYKSPKLYSYEERRVIYDRNLNGTAFYYGLYKNREMRWIRTSVVGNPKEYRSHRSFYYYCERNFEGAVYKRTLPTLAGKELVRTGLPQMIMQKTLLVPEEYLYALRQKPYLEQVAKAGLTELAWDFCKGKNLPENQNATGELTKILGIDKARLKRLRERKGGYHYWNWLKLEKIHDKVVSDDVIQYFEQQKIEPEQLTFIADRMSCQKICNYLKKQQELTGENAKDLLTTWQDYLSMASHLKMDITNSLFYSPRNLVESHDHAIKLCGGTMIAKRIVEIVKKYPNVENVCQAVAEKYELKGKKYMVLMPRSLKEIIMDSEALGHCLHWSDVYYDRIQSQETYIGFLRRTKEPDKPYYTLEIEPGGTIRQLRTIGNKQNADVEDARGFLRKWQREVQKRMSPEDRLLAEKSAFLRVKELQKLRDDNTRIWNGHLKGKLLADVLEDDLMEAALCSMETNSVSEERDTPLSVA